MEVNYESLKTIVDSFKKADIKTSKVVQDKNIFEIAGYPHYENVISNILSFFFDTKEQHGYEDCWIKSLVNCYLKKRPRIDIYSDSISTSNIEREYSNGSEKRIDLLIDCDSFLVLIENKIYASFYNDMDTYEIMAKNYLNLHEKDNVPVLKIVLSLTSVNNIKQDDVINIKYDEMIAEFEKNKKDYRVPIKWQTLNDEFIENIKRREKNMEVNNDWIEFAENNAKDVGKLIDVYNESCRERFDFCKKLWKAVKEQDESLDVGTYSGGRVDPYYSTYLNIKVNDYSTICIETYVMKKPTKKSFEDYSKVYVALWTREPIAKRTWEYLSTFVIKMDVKSALKHESDGWKQQFILQMISLSDVNIDKLANDIIEYARAIKKQ